MTCPNSTRRSGVCIPSLAEDDLQVFGLTDREVEHTTYVASCCGPLTRLFTFVGGRLVCSAGHRQSRQPFYRFTAQRICSNAINIRSFICLFVHSNDCEAPSSSRSEIPLAIMVSFRPVASRCRIVHVFSTDRINPRSK